MNKLTSLLLLLITLFSCSNQEGWKDASLTSEQRASSLLEQMTLQEKVRQMNMTRGDYLKTEGVLDTTKIVNQIGNVGLGSIHDFYPKTANEYNTVQEYTINNSRLHIPAMLMEEMLHGYHTEGATVFPMPLAMGSSWNKDLMKKVGKVIGTEARINGAHVALGPTLGIAREPRWGRVAELYSEDTHLATELGYNLIVGMGGKDPKSPYAMIAGPKHFAVHSAPITGSNASPVLLGERTSRTDFLPVFEKAVKEGGALNLMSSYSELDGVPCTGNSWLLDDVLRKEWGFKGFVVSDLGAMRFLWNVHNYAASPREAIRIATEAGLDMQFYDFPDSMYQATLMDLVKSGDMDVKHINRAVKGILYTKFELGLFENPYVTQDRIDKNYHSKENQKVAYDIASESIVLLENDGILPLKKNKHKKIAVLGPLAAESELGGYTHESAHGISILEGLKKASPNTIFTYEKGASIVERGTVIQPEYLFHDNGKKGLKASFYNNMELEGEPVLEMVHDQIDFEWPWNPYPGIEDDFFSVKWEGYIKTDVDVKGWVGTSCDDGSKIFIDDELIVDAWKESTVIKTAPFTFKKGRKYKIKYEYYDRQWHASASLRWSKKDDGIPNAIRLAKEAELSIIVVGENDRTVNENRDVAHLGISGNQLELIKKVAKIGKPYVVVLQNGRPLSTNWVSENANALVEGWFAGEQGGLAIADMLFGETNPSGKMPISVAKSVGQLPVYYNQKPTTIHRYVDESDQRLYNFGYGLSYATFDMSEPKIEVNENADDFTVKVSIDVKNTSKIDGQETIQLYVRDMISSVTTPPLSLKSFDKKRIKAGEIETFELTITKNDLKIWNQQKEWIVEKGAFKAMIGNSSTHLKSLDFDLKSDYKI